MATKRIYFETEKTVVTKTKGWIDVEMGFMQVYETIFRHTKNLKSKYAIHYVLWIMNEANENNMIPHNKEILERFSNEFEEKPSIGTIQNAISELVKNKIFFKYSNGSYQINPLLIWSEDANKRINEIKGMSQYDPTFNIEKQTIKTSEQIDKKVKGFAKRP